MFGMSNKEKVLLLSIIADRDRQIEKLEKRLDTQIADADKIISHERLRAEGAINLLLARTVKAVLTPENPLTDEEQNQRLEKMMDLFGDEGQSGMSKVEEEKILTELQTLRTK